MADGDKIIDEDGSYTQTFSSLQMEVKGTNDKDALKDIALIRVFKNGGVDSVTLIDSRADENTIPSMLEIYDQGRMRRLIQANAAGATTETIVECPLAGPPSARLRTGEALGDSGNKGTPIDFSAAQSMENAFLSALLRKEKVSKLGLPVELTGTPVGCGLSLNFLDKIGMLPSGK